MSKKVTAYELTKEKFGKPNQLERNPESEKVEKQNSTIIGSYNRKFLQNLDDLFLEVDLDKNAFKKGNHYYFEWSSQEMLDKLIELRGPYRKQRMKPLEERDEEVVAKMFFLLQEFISNEFQDSDPEVEEDLLRRVFLSTEAAEIIHLREDERLLRTQATEDFSCNEHITDTLTLNNWYLNQRRALNHLVGGIQEEMRQIREIELEGFNDRDMKLAKNGEYDFKSDQRIPMDSTHLRRILKMKPGQDKKNPFWDEVENLIMRTGYEDLEALKKGLKEFESGDSGNHDVFREKESHADSFRSAEDVLDEALGAILGRGGLPLMDLYLQLSSDKESRNS
ncbi:hypothetical protein [Alkalicoccus urumqiensis]|uniref:Uncharacterized protein n=1 Tax=Alkalicoccus urumqiensis TaxID=1548213 RepID=A0A2P6MHT8_ALKUR|nr:hypothetical protein [Alkalicoccus urumqiensis]PRO65808.1 hypothetical protein C6I21_07880 [Alkalicoccus urumqiensis]